MKKWSFVARIVLGSLCPFAASTALTARAQTTYTWDGGGSDNNWSTAANWVGDVAPVRGDSAFATFAGSTRTTTVNNQGDWSRLAGMTFAAGASSFRIEGNNIGFWSGIGEQVINQNAAATQEINTVFSFGPDQNSRINLNAGDLVISAANVYIDSAASVRNFTVTGSDSTRQTVTFAGNVNKGGTQTDPDMYIQANKRALVTGSLTFGSGNDGCVFIDDGVLQFSGAGSMTGGRPVIGNMSGSGNAALWLDTAGTTFARQLELRSGSSGRRTIGGLNTSGTVTFSNELLQTVGTPDFDLAAATGGTTVFSGQRTATGGLGVNRADGATSYGGTVELSNNDAVGSTSTVVHAGTLRLNQTAGNGWGVVRGELTVNPGATLALTGNNAALGWESAGRVSSLSLGAGSLVNSNTQHVWLGGGVASLTGATMQTNGGVSTTTGDYFEWGDSPVTTNASATSSQIAGRIRLRGDNLVARTLAFTVADGAAATDLLVSAAITESQDGVGQGNAGISKFGAGTMKLTGVGSYTNATKLHAGVLEVTGFGQLGTGEFEFNADSGDSGTLRYAGGSTTTTKTLWIDNTGITRAAIDVSEAGTTLTWNPGGGTRNQNLTKTGAGALVFGGTLAGGTVGVEAGTLTLTGNNTLSGGVVLGAGTLALGSANALGSTGTISFGGGTLQFSASNTTDYSGRFSNAANQQVRIDTNGQAIELAANLTSVGGTLTKTGGGPLTLSGTNTYTGGTVISGGWVIGSPASLQGAITNDTQVYFVAPGTYTGVMSGSGSTDIDVTGTVRFTAANTYSNETTVTNGTFQLDGSIASFLAVSALGTLSGTGTVGGNAIIRGNHSPGSSPGIQSFAGNLTYSADEGAPQVTWELIANSSGSAGVNFDQVAVGGDLAFATATSLLLSFDAVDSAVDWANPFWDVNRSWTIYDLSTGTTTGLENLSIAGSLLDSLGNTLSPTRGSFTTALSGQDVVLNFTAVPEPSAVVLAGLGTALLVGLRRCSRGRRAGR